MSRALAFLAALIGVISGTGALVNWASHHVSPSVIVSAALALWALFMTVVIPNHELRTRRGWIKQVPYLVVVAVLASLATMSYLGAFIFSALGILQFAFLANRYDQRTHKLCPDCAERVNVEARICRYCWREFSPRVDAPSPATE